jgi:hypothetical protein
MDDHRFDTLTRALAAGTPRRTALRLLGAGLAASAVALTGREAGAQRGQIGICHKSWAWSSDWRYITVDARDERRIEAHLDHGDTIDPDFSSDPNHCGDCGITCDAGYTCDGGSCVSTSSGNASLDGSDPTFAGGCLAGYHYDAYTFEHAGGTLSVTVLGNNSGGGSLNDPVVRLFTGGVPTDSCSAIASNDDAGCGLDSYLVVDQPAGTYTAVVTEFNNQFGTYTFERDTFNDPCT